MVEDDDGKVRVLVGEDASLCFECGARVVFEVVLSIFCGGVRVLFVFPYFSNAPS